MDRDDRVIKRQGTTTTAGGTTTAAPPPPPPTTTTTPTLTSTSVSITPTTPPPTTTAATTPPPTTTSAAPTTSASQVPTVVPTTATPTVVTPSVSNTAVLSNVTGVVTVTRPPASSTSAGVIPTVSPTGGSTSPQGFFQNTAAVGATFAVVGLAALAILFVIGTTCIRRRRARKFDEDVSAAAATAAMSARAAPPFGDDVDDREFASREFASSDRHHYSQPMAVRDDYRGGNGGFAGPDMYSMNQMAQHPYGAPLQRQETPSSIPGVAGVGSGGQNAMYDNSRGPPRQSYGYPNNNRYTQRSMSPPPGGYDQYGYPIMQAPQQHYQQHGYDGPNNNQYAMQPYPPQRHQPGPHQQEYLEDDDDDAYGGAYIQPDEPARQPPGPPSFPSSSSGASAPALSPNGTTAMSHELSTPTPSSNTHPHPQMISQQRPPLPHHDSMRESFQDAEDYTGRRPLKVANE